MVRMLEKLSKKNNLFYFSQKKDKKFSPPF